MERRLAVILVADIVGYSAAMERDEEGTFLRLSDRRRDLFEPEIARHGGRIFKSTGDGLLAEFSSTVQAVECAVSLQDGLAARNADAAPEDRIEARIGINLGEVIVEGDDLFGEGVNIAARLEPLADPGGICVSDKVAREVEKKLAFGFEPMGQRHVKNIVEPVSVFRVRRNGVPMRTVRATSFPRWRLPVLAAAVAAMAVIGLWIVWQNRAPLQPSGPPVLAVRPFFDAGGDATQASIGAAVSSDIITLLSTSPLVRVLSRSSSFSAPPEADARKVARLLQADYVLEGSLKRDGTGYGISASLIDGADGHRLWSQTFSGPEANVAAAQEEIAAKVYATVAGIRGEVVRVEQTKAGGVVPSSGEYDYHLRGAAEFLKWDEQSKYRAWKIWTEGLQKYPDSALLKLELAAVSYNRTIDGPTADPWQDIQTAERLIGEAAQKPERTRIEEWLLYFIRAEVTIPATGDFAAAAEDARAAHALVPYDPLSSADLSQVIANAGETATAVEWAEFAVRNEAVVPDWYRDNLAWAYLMAGRSEDAARIYGALSYYCVPCKAVALVRTGKLEDARQEIEAHRKRFPGWSIEDVRTFPGGRYPFMVPAQMDPYLADLRAAGLK